MFIWRAKELLEGGGELLRAEVELAIKRLRRLMVSSILLVAAALIVAVGAGVFLAGVAIAVAAVLGWTWSLLIIGGGLLLVGLVVWIVAYSRESAPHGDAAVEEDAQTDPLEQARDAKERMRDAATPGGNHSAAAHGPAGPQDFASTAVGFAAKNPALVGSAAFLALSLVGPARLLRVASRGAALAGLGATLLNKFKDEWHEQETARRDTADPLPRRHSPVSNHRAAHHEPTVR